MSQKGWKATSGFTVILPGGCWDTLLTMRERAESTSKEQLENRALELSYQEAQEEAEVTICSDQRLSQCPNGHKLL